MKTASPGWKISNENFETTLNIFLLYWYFLGRKNVKGEGLKKNFKFKAENVNRKPMKLNGLRITFNCFPCFQCEC